MIESIINCENPFEADVVLLAANYDKTSSFGKGADKGPVAVKDCLDGQIEITNPELKISYYDPGDLNSMEPEIMVSMLERRFGLFYDEGKFMITLGGEHSVSNGPFKHLASKQDAKDITIFQIDAHLDMRDTDADYRDKPFGKYAHSCVMRRGAELGFKTVQVGMRRAYSKEEYEFARQHGSKVFEWGKGFTGRQIVVPSIDNIVNAIETDQVYVTIDVDGFDPVHMPETGTPVQGGLEWWYGVNLLRKVFEQKKIVAADIVEIAPKLDPSLTAYGAAQLIYWMVGWKFNKKW